MGIQGLRDTSNFVTDQRIKNWREGILHLKPNGTAPLTALTSRMKTKKTDDPEFNWWTKTMQTRRVQLTANAAAAATTLTVSSGALGLKKRDVLYAEETGELMLVAADPSSDTSITVQRSIGDVAATLIDYDGSGVNPYLRVVGSMNPEGSLAPSGVNFDVTKLYNYTQIFRNTLEMTRTAKQTRLRTGDQVAEAKRECLELHTNDMEMAFWLGDRVETTFDGKPARMTRGVINWIDSNNIVDNAGAAIDMEFLEQHLELAFRFGSSEKMAFCGNLSLMAINQAVRKNSQYNIQFGLKEFGMQVARLVCPFGEVVLKTHPLWNQMVSAPNPTTSGTYYGMNSWVCILDMAELVYRPMQDTMWEPKLEANGLDGMQAGYLTEAGLEFHHPVSHYLIKGVASGTADS